MDEIDRIIACVRQEEVDNTASWVGRHEEQADGEVFADEVDLGGANQFCVAYEPGVDLDITYPEQNEWGEELKETLRDVVFKSTYAGVNVPARTGCDEVWDDWVGSPTFDSELEFSKYNGPKNVYHMASTQICMTPEEFLRVQFGMLQPETTESAFSVWLSDLVSEKAIEDIRKYIRTGESPTGRNDVYEGLGYPRPYLEFDRNGDIVESQEGRHRGIAAWRENVPMMGVYVFANHKNTRGIPEHEFKTPPRMPGDF